MNQNLQDLLCENCGNGELLEVAYNVIDEHGHNKTLCWHCVCNEYIRIEAVKMQGIKSIQGGING